MKGQIIETMDIVDKSLLKFCLCGYNLRVGFWVTISFVIREQEQVIFLILTLLIYLSSKHLNAFYVVRFYTRLDRERKEGKQVNPPGVYNLVRVTHMATEQ